jgi:hypothetical protein
LPDNWTLPSGCRFSAGLDECDDNIYTLQQWAKMESAGAVFLPGTGVRTPIIMASVFNGRDYGINNFGNYWTSTRGENYGGYSVGFFLDELFLSLCDFNSKDGRAVRLAKVND